MLSKEKLMVKLKLNHTQMGEVLKSRDNTAEYRLKDLKNIFNLDFESSKEKLKYYCYAITSTEIRYIRIFLKRDRAHFADLTGVSEWKLAKWEQGRYVYEPRYHTFHERILKLKKYVVRKISHV